MPISFGQSSTAAEVLDGVDLAGKRILITGAGSGIGLEAARTLAERGAQVTGAVRDPAKARDATDAVRDAARVSGGVFDLIALDLSSLASVGATADALLARGDPFDVVVTNAGVMVMRHERTVDGFEMNFGTNHLGHFVLANRIAPLIRPGGRLVALTSAAHRMADIDLDDPGIEAAPMDLWTGYGRSKTANILFAVEFDRRHRERGVRATAVHPGGISSTALMRRATRDDMMGLVASMDESADGQRAAVFMKTISQGAATTVWAAAVADADAVGGRYCEDCHVAEITGGRALDPGVRNYAVDPARAKALWALSETLVGERF